MVLAVFAFAALLASEPVQELGDEERSAVENVDVDVNVGATRATTVLAPPVAIVAGTVAGLAASFVLGYGGSPLPGAVAAAGGFAVGVATFEVTLGLLLHALLPPLPPWTLPVALATATMAGAAGLALSAGLSYAYLTTSGSDGCGPELFIMPAAIFATTTAGASTATTLTVMVAELE